MSWIQATNDGITLTVKVTPRAKKTEVLRATGDWIQIRLNAPPVDGKANVALIRFLAETLGVSRSSVTIATGASAHLKRIRVAGVSEEAARKILEEAVAGK